MSILILVVLAIRIFLIALNKAKNEPSNKHLTSLGIFRRSKNASTVFYGEDWMTEPIWKFKKLEEKAFY